MAEIANELMLLERVFLRLGSAASDEQLENVLSKFLVPVLLKLSSPEETVRKKVMELLIHVNKRIKTRPLVQLPVEPLLSQYHNPDLSSFVTNFTIIYVKSGFPRLPIEAQAQLVPKIINALKDKPLSHIDSLLFLIVPLLGKVKVPTEPDKIKTYFGLNENPAVSKHLRDILLDVILLPYSSLNLHSQENDTNNPVQISVPPGMSQASLRRVTENHTFKPEQFESIKLGIIKFLAHGIFKPEDVLIHLIVAASDTRFEVANLADMELKKIVGLINWSSPQISKPLFTLFLGSKSDNEDQVRKAANTRIRLKLLNHLCRVRGEAFVFPFALKIVFQSLYDENTNTKLKGLALNYTTNLIRYYEGEALKKDLSQVLLWGLTKLIKDGESAEHDGQAYMTIGILAQKYPHAVFGNVNLLEFYFNNLEAANPNLKVQVREGLLNLIPAYKYDVFPDDLNKDGRLDIILALIKVKLISNDPMVRFACVRTLSTIFPPDNVPSKFLLLTAIGDSEDDVHQEAFKSIYGIAKWQNDFDLAKAVSKMPPFKEMAKYMSDEVSALMTDKNRVVLVGNHSLPFAPKVYLEILLYLRLCLLRTSNVPLTREVPKHPCEYSPKIRESIQFTYQHDKDIFVQYCSMIKPLLLAQPGSEVLSCMIELIGSVPELDSLILIEANWIRDQLSNVKEDVREYASILYSLVVAKQCKKSDFDATISYLLEQTSKNNLEAQHGALLGIGACLEAYAFDGRREGVDFDKFTLVKEALNVIAPFLKHPSPVLVGAAAAAIGSISRAVPLPLETSGGTQDGSPHAKKQAIGPTKLELVEIILGIMNNSKLSVKVRERAARTLGLLCVGERFAHDKLIIKGLLQTSKDTKDVEVHFTIGESLLMCCQSVSSPEARDAWQVLPDEFFVDGSEEAVDTNLDWFLDELLKLAGQAHPNSKQASCIWLLAVLKGCGKRKPIEGRLQIIQNTFMNFLCENNDIVQDVASKGLCLIYDYSKSSDLLTTLVNQLTSGTRNVTQVTSDTKLFQEGQLGSTPSGENLTTYKELCSLASDLNKPDLIYKFMHLANHNAMWNSKKGAAFGFSSIAEKCGEDLKKLMPEIVPKLYRYQFDPTPNIHDSMSNIWRVLVSDPQNALDTYYPEILKDILANMNSSQYRVRQSCCLALQDFLKGSAHRSIHDAVDYMDELWNKLFRVMDDHHEATRTCANRTARVLSKLCIRGSDSNQGKAGLKMIEVLLPILLNTGITHTVPEIRIISLQTVSELVDSAGQQIKPSLAKLIPALLQATGELESSKLAYLSTMMGAQTETQEVIDSARASIAKSHFATETVSKSLRYADASMLDELIPKVLELMKGTVGLGTRIACAHFITLLVVQLGVDVQPFSGKLLSSLVNGLTDRNSAVRKHNAMAIGHLVGVCKSSSLEKLFAKLQLWYFEREDDSIRSAIAHTIQSIGIHNQEVIKNCSKTILPLVFFATHVEKCPETENTLNIWQEIWSEHSPGTESGIRNNIEPICDMLKQALESPSWTLKAQAANAVTTVANKLGSTMEMQHSNSLLTILLAGLMGKTWKGKDKLLKALCSICSNGNRDFFKNNKEIGSDRIIEAVCREARKQEVVYKLASLECLGEVVSALKVDSFEQVYEIVKTILQSDLDKDEDEDNVKEHRENQINLKIVAYETLGKSWPENYPKTQEKFQNLFVSHCVEALPNVTRTIQTAILSALYNFVNKLSLLQKQDLTAADKADLQTILDKLLDAITYSFGISKHTRLRKEALNIVFCLATKLKEKESDEELKKLRHMFTKALESLSNDSQPEIKCRVLDIKQILI
ncbi:proteasome adapter and scaffold protein ECM29 [Euwallacea fornicatus]|uniref:proteasome adapter and scaffold protein ECM29 n=1 Tax=Euwallacea fornicatus TaxID=995702 RepID=UPI00338DE333